MATLSRQDAVKASDSRDARVEVGAVARRTTLDLALLSFVVLATHLAVAGPIPSGGDGGNWLALAREVSGQSVMSAEVAYEPVFIGLVALFVPLFGLIGGLISAAMISELILVFAVYLIGRQLGRIQGLASAACVFFLGYRLEAYAWGAYPQMLAVGVGLISLWLLCRYLAGGDVKALLVALGLGALTLSTHKLVGALLLASTPLAALHLYWQLLWDRAVLRHSLIAMGAMGVVGAGFAWSWWAETASGVEPTLNPLGLGYSEQLTRAFPSSAVPWIVVGILALTGFALRSWSRSSSVVVATGFGWLVSSVAVFVVTGEPRALIQGQVALIPVAFAVAWRLRDRLGRREAWTRSASVLLIVTGVGLAGSLVITGFDHYGRSSDWYRVVGQNQLEALSELRSLADAGDLVVASRGPNGNPIGWWVEGYAGLPTYTSVSEEFLAFPDEREQSSIAAAVFEAPPDEAAAMMDDLGARFLVFDRRGPDSAWLVGGEPHDLEVISDGTLLILEVPGS